MKYTISMMSLNITTNSSTLTIMNVQSSDVGTYTCNATNVVSTDTSSGVLTVNGESVWSLIYLNRCFTICLVTTVLPLILGILV